MSFRCAVTGKGPRAGKQISHSHRVTNRRFLPNLQKVKVMTPSGPRRTARRFRGPPLVPPSSFPAPGLRRWSWGDRLDGFQYHATPPPR